MNTIAYIGIVLFCIVALLVFFPLIVPARSRCKMFGHKLSTRIRAVVYHNRREIFDVTYCLRCQEDLDKQIREVVPRELTKKKEDNVIRGFCEMRDALLAASVIPDKRPQKLGERSVHHRRVDDPEATIPLPIPMARLDHVSMDEGESSRYRDFRGGGGSFGGAGASGSWDSPNDCSSSSYDSGSSSSDSGSSSCSSSD